MPYCNTANTQMRTYNSLPSTISYLPTIKAKREDVQAEAAVFRAKAPILSGGRDPSFMSQPIGNLILPGITDSSGKVETRQTDVREELPESSRPVGRTCSERHSACGCGKPIAVRAASSRPHGARVSTQTRAPPPTLDQPAAILTYLKVPTYLICCRPSNVQSPEGAPCLPSHRRRSRHAEGPPCDSDRRRPWECTHVRRYIKSCLVHRLL